MYFRWTLLIKHNHNVLQMDTSRLKIAIDDTFLSSCQTKNVWKVVYVNVCECG